MQKAEIERMKELEGLFICLEHDAQIEAEKAEAKAREAGEAKGAWATLAYGHSLKKGAYAEARRLLQGAIEMPEKQWKEAKRGIYNKGLEKLLEA